MGGFECATHRRRDGRRLDVIAQTRHDVRCAQDYALLARAGIRTVRDGLRWHLIERVPGQYDWSSFLPMLRAALHSQTEVFWDLCHWGVPDGLDVFSPAFPTRFAAFAAAAAAVMVEERARANRPGPNFYTLMNEISFWSWAGGEVRYLCPCCERRGPELKRQLVRATILATHAVREQDPGARFLQPEPLINVAPGTRRRHTVHAAARHTEAQFEVWDMLAGHIAPELGGENSLLDILGVNYYWNNQWVHRRETAPLGHPKHRPVHKMLADISARFGRPLLVAETGAEAEAGVGWLAYIMAEVRAARRLGATISGVCLYPVMDYPGWDDARHCRCGLLNVARGFQDRELRADLFSELELQRTLLEQDAPIAG